MTTCAKCGKTISYNEMKPLKSSLLNDNPFGNAFNAAMTAWKCDTCDDWICNHCVVGLINQYGANEIQHTNCGGFFKAPR